MMLTLDQLRTKVASQKANLPALYGDVDFATKPERFADEPVISGPDKSRNDHLRPQIMADAEKVERMRAYTMMGDTVADAYAGLMPVYGFAAGEHADGGVRQGRRGRARCASGTGQLHPRDGGNTGLGGHEAGGGRRAPEPRGLRRTIHPSSFAARSLLTFMNRYSALPMALTGALSSETAGRRVKDTASFFITSVLPGALERFGPGFKSAAMVRLMHSMVRFNALRRSNMWDVKTYGIRSRRSTRCLRG